MYVNKTSNSLNSTKTIKSKKKGKIFTERNGDWVCGNCRNLNFAFRIICNRCHLPKVESEKFVNGKFEKVKNSSNENIYKYSNFQKDDNTNINNNTNDVIIINEKK